MIVKGDLIDWHSHKGIKVVTVVLVDNNKLVVEDYNGETHTTNIEDCKIIGRDYHGND